MGIVRVKPSILTERSDKRVYVELMGKDIYQELEAQSHHLPKLMKVGQKLCDYLTELIHEDGAPLVQVLLSEGLTEWTTRYHTEGCKMAYTEFCKAIFLGLRRVYNYRVSGRRGFKPFLNVFWDCTHESLISWMQKNQIKDLRIEQVETQYTASSRELSLIIAPRIFERSDLSLWGVPDSNKDGISTEHALAAQAEEAL